MQRSSAILCLMVVGLMVLSVTPVAAATKLIDVREHNKTFTGLASATECGITGTFTLVLHVEESHFTYWSNGHFTLSVEAHLYLYDPPGTLIAFSQAGNSTSTAGQGSLPLISQNNGILFCTKASPTPGMAYTFHYGFTVGKNGSLVSVRFVTSH